MSVLNNSIGSMQIFPSPGIQDAYNGAANFASSTSQQVVSINAASYTEEIIRNSPWVHLEGALPCNVSKDLSIFNFTSPVIINGHLIETLLFTQDAFICRNIQWVTPDTNPCVILSSSVQTNYLFENSFFVQNNIGGNTFTNNSSSNSIEIKNCLFFASGSTSNILLNSAGTVKLTNCDVVDEGNVINIQGGTVIVSGGSLACRFNVAAGATLIINDAAIGSITTGVGPTVNVSAGGTAQVYNTSVNQGSGASYHFQGAGQISYGDVSFLGIGRGIDPGLSVFVSSPIFPPSAQSGTTYTLVASDAFKNVTLNNSSAITLTVPTNASVPFFVRTTINLAQYGTGLVTVAPAAGVTINSYLGQLALGGKYAYATLQKTGTNTWDLYGNLS